MKQIQSFSQSTDENVNVLYHPPELGGPILFSYREKVFFGKKRAAVRVENGDWSEKFALDAAGSTGLVECYANGTKYEVKPIKYLFFIKYLLRILKKKYYFENSRSLYTIH